MIKSVLTSAAIFAITAAAGCAQKSPPAEASATIGGKNVTIKYSAPSVRGRKIFGPDGLISHDPTFPVWRAGANSATALHTDANLDIKGLSVPAGDYTLFVNLQDPDHWELVVSKATKEWGLAYKKDMDLGRVPMDMGTPGAPVETFKITLSSTGTHAGKLEMAWADHEASVPFTVK